MKLFNLTKFSESFVESEGMQGQVVKLKFYFMHSFQRAAQFWQGLYIFYIKLYLLTSSKFLNSCGAGVLHKTSSTSMNKLIATANCLVLVISLLLTSSSSCSHFVAPDQAYCPLCAAFITAEFWCSNSQSSATKTFFF